MKHTPMSIDPITLSGQYVRLEPLSMSHYDALWAIGQDAELWKWTPYQITTPDKMHAYIKAALDAREIGTALPFVTIWQATNEIVGSTRFGNIVREHRRVEIGWTWLGTAFQRSARNTETKLLMLRHAFETWGCRRVEFKTSSTNEKSRTAMRRLGFVEEGTFRKWMVLADGSPRDTVWFSVVDDEWPARRAQLTTLLAPR